MQTNMNRIIPDAVRNMGITKPKYQKKFFADKLQSTFWWRMTFYEGRRFNKEMKPIYEMDGYSKNNGDPEAMDPGDCFCSKVVMLYQNNYFQDCEKIEFYRRAGFMCNKSTDPLYITLFQEQYIIPANDFATFNKDVRIFLGNFYKRIKDGKLPERHLVPVALKSRDDMLQRTGWNNADELMLYGDKLKAQGHTPGAIAGYIFKEMEKLHNKGKA